MFNRLATVVLLLCLAACAAPRPRFAAPQRPVPRGAGLQALPSPGKYRIDSDNSELRLLVYRAGALAGLGHNHVMVNRSISGFVQIAPNIAATAFSLSMPVSGFLVDDAQSRSEEGADFPGDVPQDAKAGTRRNMLSAAVLNAAQFSDITVQSVSLTGTWDSVIAELQISAAGHSSRISVPLMLQGDAQQLGATGSMELRQTALGITPYSLLGGALQVQDAMQLKFKIMVLTN